MVIESVWQGGIVASFQPYECKLLSQVLGSYKLSFEQEADANHIDTMRSLFALYGVVNESLPLDHKLVFDHETGELVPANNNKGSKQG